MFQAFQLVFCLSLPSRERGLKSDGSDPPDLRSRSLPSRERGLKLRVPAYRSHDRHVAPFTGAWIEMLVPLTDQKRK